MSPPEVRRGDLIGYSCDACQDLHRDVVVFRPIGDEVRVCAGCLRAGLSLLGYLVVPAIPTSAEDEAIVDRLMASRGPAGVPL